MERRDFLAAIGTAGAGLVFSQQDSPTAQGAASQVFSKPTILFEQTPLPYKPDALQPLFTEKQVRTHYEKHHAAYFNNLKGMLAGRPEEKMPLEKIVVSARKDGGALFNNAAQLWNHNFFWDCLSPEGGSPTGALLEAIKQDFGGYDAFVEKFCDASVKQFASGWGWLVKDLKDGKLSIMTTSNAETPLGTGKIPLLTADVWEHAYYVDYLNRRADFLKAMFDKVNWAFVDERFRLTVDVNL